MTSHKVRFQNFNFKQNCLWSIAVPKANWCFDFHARVTLCLTLNQDPMTSLYTLRSTRHCAPRHLLKSFHSIHFKVYKALRPKAFAKKLPTETYFANSLTFRAPTLVRVSLSSHDKQVVLDHSPFKTYSLTLVEAKAILAAWCAAKRFRLILKIHCVWPFWWPTSKPSHWF